MTITITLTETDLAAAGRDVLAKLVDVCEALAGTRAAPPVPAPTSTAAEESARAAVIAFPVPPASAPDPPPPPAVPAAAPVVPTAAAATYALEELQTACAPLLDAGRMSDLQGLLARYGAASLLDIPKEQYGALAADLRALGARI